MKQKLPTGHNKDETSDTAQNLTLLASSTDTAEFTQQLISSMTCDTMTIVIVIVYSLP